MSKPPAHAQVILTGANRRKTTYPSLLWKRLQIVLPKGMRAFVVPETEMSMAENDAVLLKDAHDIAKAKPTSSDLVFIDRSKEVGYQIAPRKAVFDEFCKISSVPVSRVFYACQGPQPQRSGLPKWIYFHHYFESMSEKYRTISDDFGYGTAGSSVLVLNNKIRPHRLAVVAHLMGLPERDRFQITWGEDENVASQPQMIAAIQEHFPSFADETRGFVHPKRVLAGSAGVGGAEDLPTDLVRQCFLEVVLETDFYDWSQRNTEKILKPIATHRPFLSFGPRRSLAMMREFGFRTFGEVIDESYDEVETADARLKAMLASLRAVLARDHREVLEACRAACAHNQAHLGAGFARVLRTKLLRDIEALLAPAPAA